MSAQGTLVTERRNIVFKGIIVPGGIADGRGCFGRSQRCQQIGKAGGGERGRRLYGLLHGMEHTAGMGCELEEIPM
jgi:hypothetical protein